MKYLVETALLTHGLKSIRNKEILSLWPNRIKNIAWVDYGKIVLGNIEDYVPFRNRHEELIRIDCQTLEESLEKGLSGALTASGTMKVCELKNIPIAVTCGMGGIGEIKGEELCPDLPALRDIPVTLISTGPKDMLDRKQTFRWLKDQGVIVLGSNRSFCTGYVFKEDPIHLDGIIENQAEKANLIIQEIPEEKRIQDQTILQTAIQAGKEAEKQGQYFHPAVNGKIDSLTQGYSSRIQLESLIENIKLAERI